MTPFDQAVQAVTTGEEAALAALLAGHPALVRERAVNDHEATLLHYVGANGLAIQASPPNAPEIARLLLAMGAEADSVAPVYGSRAYNTTLCLAVTSVVPFLAGIQADIVDALADYGAKVDGIDDDGAPLGCALMFGYTQSAERLVLRGARVDNIVYAAGLGRADVVRRMLNDGSGMDNIPRRNDDHAGRFSFPIARGADVREVAFLAAAMHGRRSTIQTLLDAGVSVNAAPYCNQTALHHAAYLGRTTIVEELLSRGADPRAVDTQMGTTPAQWARELNNETIALRIETASRINRASRP